MSKRVKVPEYKGLYRVTRKDGEVVFYGMYRKPDGKRAEVSLGKETETFTSEHAAHELFKYKTGENKSGYDKRMEQIELKQERLRTTWVGFWECYSEHVDDNGKVNSSKASHYESTRIFQQHITPYFKTIQPHTVTEEDAKNFKQHILKMECSDGFKRNIFELFKRVLRHNKNMYVIGVPLPKIRKKTKICPTESQLKRLMGILQVPQYPYNGKVYRVNRIVANCMLLMRYTGMRSLETRKLQWRDVNFTRNTILLREPKGGVDSTIPMSKKARAVLESQIPPGYSVDNPPVGSDFVFLSRDGGMISNYVKTAKQYCVHAGIPDGFPPCHGMRSLYASELNEKGVPLTYIQKLLTHKSVGTTMGYIAIDEDALRDAANLID